jgi:Z1 domain-containing protein
MTPPDDQNEVITPQEELPAGSLWVPVQGAELRGLLDHLRLDPDSKETLATEAATILGKCIPPQGNAESTTGLVLGFVQSGKTLSFTSVAALARDNGYPMVIVITGIATNLLDQSRGRLEADLRLQTNRKWRLFLNPKADQHQAVADVLRDWSNPRLADHRRKTVLITVLKHGTHLRNLVALLGQLDLTRIPVLVIDDEADQAGLNTQVARGRQSTTYQRLVALRGCLPHHTYLQYTATPQAPLLINLIDTLSPKFAELLTPGDDYVGGEGFFEQNQNLVRVIPANEIPNQGNRVTDPPPSLISALKLFFVGVAVGFRRGEDQNAKNRSMLVHPSRETPGHGQYHHWITQIRVQWLELLNLAADDHEREQFVESFRAAYDDLHRMVADLPTFDEIATELEYAIRQTEILEVNARPKTPPVDWKITYPWILVGGQAMDRGFTIEGLTVTYMPRDMGVGNADTIQQRARFFGYKRPYLGFCRVFLEQGLFQAFQAYVAHERDIRQRLSAHRGRPLTDWRRAFFLETALSPTRRQVLDLDYRQDVFSNRWFWPKVPHGTADLLTANRDTVGRFVATLPWHDDEGDARRTPEQVHFVSEGVPLRRAYEDLLTPLRFTDEYDSQAFTGVLLQIGEYLQANPGATCTLYRMSKDTQRIRSVNDDEEIPTLFQGAYPVDAAHRGEIYPGDERIRATDGLTIQIHTLEVHEKSTVQGTRGPVIANRVPTVAVWVPSAMSRDWLVQQQ